MHNIRTLDSDTKLLIVITGAVLLLFGCVLPLVARQPDPTSGGVRVLPVLAGPPPLSAFCTTKGVTFENTGFSPVTLDGWTIGRKTGSFSTVDYTIPAYTLWPGQRLTVWASAGTDDWWNLHVGRQPWPAPQLNVLTPSGEPRLSWIVIACDPGP